MYTGIPQRAPCAISLGVDRSTFYHMSKMYAAEVSKELNKSRSSYPPHPWQAQLDGAQSLARADVQSPDRSRPASPSKVSRSTMRVFIWGREVSPGRGVFGSHSVRNGYLRSAGPAPRCPWHPSSSYTSGFPLAGLGTSTPGQQLSSEMPLWQRNKVRGGDVRNTHSQTSSRRPSIRQRPVPRAPPFRPPPPLRPDTAP